MKFQRVLTLGFGTRAPWVGETYRRTSLGTELLRFAVEASGDVLKVTFRGDLGNSRYAEVCRALSLGEHSPRNVLIAFDETVTFADSFTLSEIMQLQRRLNRGGRLVALHVVSEQVYKTLVLMGVVGLLRAFRDEEAALKALRETKAVP